MNATFYRLPKRDVVANWVETSPPAFLFAVKMSRYITHLKRLHDLVDADPRRLESLRFELNRHLTLHATDDLHLSDAGNSSQLAGDVRVGKPRQLRGRHRR